MSDGGNIPGALGQVGVRALKLGMAQETTDQVVDGVEVPEGQSLVVLARRLLDKNPLSEDVAAGDFHRTEFLDSLAAMEEHAPEQAEELVALIEKAMSYLRVRIVRSRNRYDVSYHERSGIKVTLPNIDGRFCPSDPPPLEDET